VKTKTHITSEQLLNYRRRALAPPELIAVDEHIAECSACRANLASGGWTHEIFESLLVDLRDEGATDHLANDQLRAYVEGSLAEATRLSVSNHLSACSVCQYEVAHLREAQIASQSRRAGPAPGNQASPQKWLSKPLWKLSGLPFAVRIAIGVFILAVMAGIYFFAINPKATNQIDTSATRVEDQLRKDHENEDAHNIGATEAKSAVDKAESEDRTADDSGENPRLSLMDGGEQIILEKDGRITGLNDAPENWRQAVAQALSSERIKISPVVAELRGRRGTTMGPSQQKPEFELLVPVGVVIESAQPVLRWRPLIGASSYVVRVFSANDVEVLASEQITACEWKVPKPLSMGASYSWQVTAYKEGDVVVSPRFPAPPARFKVIGRRMASELMRVKRDAAHSHFLLGVMYAEAGLLDDARREIRLLLHDNRDPQVVERLLKSLDR
jgi:anti-sigma factor RsiW